MSSFLREEIKNKRSQDLPPYYRINGAIYLSGTKVFLENKSFFLQRNIYCYIMDRKYSIDIDSKEDLEIASILEAYIRRSGENEGIDSF